MRLELLAVLLLALAGCARPPDPADGRIVHREKSMYRDLMVVELNGYRCMTFGRHRTMQSCILLSDPDMLALPYSRGVFAGLVANPGAKRALVIGLGGGVIPRALRRIDPSMRIDVIELDPAVVDVAKQYFGYREDPALRTFTGDGRVFVRRRLRAGVRYDLIVIDAFERVYVPEHMLTREFIGEVKSLLSPHGVIASNTFASGPLAPYEAATYQSVFGQIRVIDVAMGSRIILAGRDGLPADATTRDNAAALEGRFHTIGILKRELQSHPQPEIEGYRPLTDQYAPANLLFKQ
ncbi:MAG: fused MFS/spermidine synthase [Lysobacter sp.]|nr:fused MFS/spermidine synthase [Lysobacter sp.]